MQSYLTDIKNEITTHFGYIKNWNNEIKSIDSIDTTFIITKKNFLIVGLNSINEFLLERIIFLYYEKYFNLILNETNFENYTKYELAKIEKVIQDNHNASFGGFKSMLNMILGDVIGKEKINEIKQNITKFREFDDTLAKIYSKRNKIGHNSELYFKEDKEIDFNIDDLNNTINILEEGFKNLADKYFEVTNGFLKIKLI